MPMIQIDVVGRNQFVRAHELRPPVVVSDRCTFRVPSSRPGGRDHKIQLDDPELPLAYSCTCDAGLVGRPCWAIARVLDALEDLRAAGVYVCRDAASVRGALDDFAGALTRPTAAGFGAAGELVMLWSGQEPEAGMLYAISERAATPQAGTALDVP